eukprot:1373721-Alexandrium_andersonii.AAC.1
MSASLVGSEMCIRDRLSFLVGRGRRIAGNPRLAPLLDRIGTRAGVRKLGPARALRPLKRTQI